MYICCNNIQQINCFVCRNDKCEKLIILQRDCDLHVNANIQQWLETKSDNKDNILYSVFNDISSDEIVSPGLDLNFPKPGSIDKPEGFDNWREEFQVSLKEFIERNMNPRVLRR